MSEGAAMERLFMVLAAVVCTCAVRASAGDDVGPSIEALGAPIDLQQTDEASALDDLIEPVGLSRDESVARRLYVAGIIGNSFATLATPLGPNGNYQATDRLSLYIGGGIGGGGYQFSYLKQSAGGFVPPNYQIATTNNVSTFAWQAGGGTAYAITDRITLDIGYRYFQIANSTSTGVISYVPVPVGSEVIGSAFSASELFFAFRIYEPFRNWR